MIGSIAAFFTTTINYNSSQSMAVLRLAPFLTGLRVSSLLLWLTWSDSRVGHFFSFRCPLVNTPQLNTELSYEWRMPIDGSRLPRMNWTNSFITSGQTEYKSLCLTVSLLFCFSVFNLCRGNVITETLPSSGLFRGYLLQREHAYWTVAQQWTLPRLFFAAGTCV
jgi:hypothetical protein